jgi:DNA invertase Pin-like site-specific DNA recombinase
VDATAYLRWSDQHQSRGSSLTRQTNECNAFAVEIGWHFDEVLIEDGLSAFKGANLEKGKLGQLEKRIRAGEFAGRGLMVERLDRLSRQNGFDAMRWFGDMVECGATVAIASHKMVVDSKSIRNQEHQLRALLDEMGKANSYSDTLSKRIRPAWAAMRNGKEVRVEHDGTIAALTVVGAAQDVVRVEVSRGPKLDTYWVNLAYPLFEVGGAVSEGQVLGIVRQKVHTQSTCPAWLELIENRTTFSVRNDIAAILQRIFNLYVSTDLGARGIARLLNGEGVATLRFGRCWHGSTVKALLANRGLIGEYAHREDRKKNGQVVGDYFPAIISDALFQTANDRKLTRIKSNHSRTSRLRHLFSDVGKCFKCGSKLTFVTKRITPAGRFDSYAICSNGYLHAGCDAKKKGLRMLAVEDAVLDRLLVFAMDDEHFQNDDALPELRNGVADKRRALADIQRRIDALLDIIGDPSFRRDERFDMRLRSAQNEEHAAKEALEVASVALTTAQGLVTPQEHVRRVNDIRADLWSIDETKGMDARRKVKMAINDLVEIFYICPDQEKVVVVLKNRVRQIVLNWRGEVTIDIPVSRQHALPGEGQVLQAYFGRLARARSGG